MSDEKPAVLIIGGLGYVGRFLALHLHKNNLASEVRIVDKLLPQLAWLAPEFKEACSQDKFMQADASKEANMSRIFTRSNGKEFDYVFNCGGETRYSQEDEVYRVRSHILSLTVANEAAKRKIRAFVELSTGMVYKPKEKPRKETDELKPWLKLAKWKLDTEEALKKIKDLNLVILRLAHVYGPYTSTYLATALCLARVYKYEEETMKWLWDRSLRQNTVHVTDVARAMLLAATHISQNPAKSPLVYNIVDNGATSQGHVADILASIFNIPMKFEGALVSKMAMLKLDSVVDDANDDTLDPWAELQEQAGITEPTPLSPFLEKELVKDNDLSLDGGNFCEDLGFTYEHPKLTKEEVEAVIESYRSMKWWP